MSLKKMMQYFTIVETLLKITFQGKKKSPNANASNNTQKSPKLKNGNIVKGNEDGTVLSDHGADPEGARLLGEITTLRHRIRQRLSQKAAIAKNMGSIIEKFNTKVCAYAYLSLDDCISESLLYYPMLGGLLQSWDTALSYK